MGGLCKKLPWLAMDFRFLGGRGPASLQGEAKLGCTRIVYPWCEFSLKKKITPERGEGDASDSIGGNTGELIGTVSFADGYDLTVLGSGKWLQTRRQGLAAYCVNSIVVRFRSISTTSPKGTRNFPQQLTASPARVGPG